MKRQKAVGRLGRASVVVFTLAMADATVISMPVAALPKMVAAVGGTSLSRVALIVGAMQAVVFAAQALASPIYGRLSDQKNAAVLLTIGFVGLALASGCAAISTSLPILFISRILAGIFSANMTVLTRIITRPDESSEWRASRYGILGAMVGIGASAGMVIGGGVAVINVRTTFLVSSLVSIVAAIMANKLPKTWTNVSAESLIRPTSPSRKLVPRALIFQPAALRIVAPALLANLSQTVLGSIFVLYSQAELHWSAAQTGAALGMFAAGSVVSKIVLLSQLVRRFRKKTVIMCALSMGVLGYLVLASARSSVGITIGLLALCLAGLAGPILQALLSDAAEVGQIGQIQGEVYALLAGSSVMAPIMYGFAYNWCPTTWAGQKLSRGHAPFLISATGTLLALLLTRAIKVIESPSHARRKSAS